MPVSVISQPPVIDRGLGSLWLSPPEGVAVRVRLQLHGGLWDNLTGRALTFVAGAFRKALDAGTISTERWLRLSGAEVQAIADAGARRGRILDETGAPVRRWWSGALRFRDGDPGVVAEGELGLAEAVLEDALVVMDLGSVTADALIDGAPEGFRSFGQVRMILDRGWYDLAAYGGDPTGLGFSDDAYDALAENLRPTGGAMGMFGRFKFGRKKDCGGIRMVGHTPGWSRTEADLAVPQHMIINTCPEPLFQPTRNGWAMEGCVIWDPAQTGEGFLPVVRPPLIATPGELIDVDLIGNVLINPYRLLHLPPTGKMGGVRIQGNRIYGVDRLYDVEGYVPERVVESGNFYSAGVFQQGAVFNPSAMLAKYTARNGVGRRVDTSHSIDGWAATDNIFFGFRHRDQVLRGLLNICSHANETLDGVASLLTVSGTGGVAGYTRTGGVAFSYTYGGPNFVISEVATDAFSFNTSGQVDVSVTGMAGEFASDRWMADTGTGRTEFKFAASHLRNWGIRRAENLRPAIYSSNPNAVLAIEPMAMQAYMPWSLAALIDDFDELRLRTAMIGSGAGQFVPQDRGVLIREDAKAQGLLQVVGASSRGMSSGETIRDDRSEGRFVVAANAFDGAVIPPGVIL